MAKVNMPLKWRRTFLMWTKRPEHQRLVAAARAEIRRVNSRYRTVVAFSGGKDSTVLLHLALQVNPDIHVFHWDHGPWLMPRQIERQIIENARQLGARNLIVRGSKLLETPEARTNWRVWYLTFWNTLARLRKDYGWEKNLVGLRGEESHRRRRTIRRHDRKWEVYPLADWSWLDVWGYIVSRSLPYPSIYDKYARLLGYDKTRLVTFFDHEFEKYGAPWLDGFLMPENRFSAT